MNKFFLMLTVAICCCIIHAGDPKKIVIKCDENYFAPESEIVKFSIIPKLPDNEKLNITVKLIAEKPFTTGKFPNRSFFEGTIFEKRFTVSNETKTGIFFFSFDTEYALYTWGKSLNIAGVSIQHKEKYSSFGKGYSRPLPDQDFMMIAQNVTELTDDQTKTIMLFTNRPKQSEAAESNTIIKKIAGSQKSSPDEITLTLCISTKNTLVPGKENKPPPDKSKHYEFNDKMTLAQLQTAEHSVLLEREKILDRFRKNQATLAELNAIQRQLIKVNRLIKKKTISP